MKIIIRKTNSALYRASHPPISVGDVATLAALLEEPVSFYFMRIRRANKRWWEFWKEKWEDTGEIWEPESGEFDVLDENDPRDRARLTDMT